MASNWAAFSFIVGSIGMYQWCGYTRQAEKDGMRRAVEILNRNQLEKKAREARKEKQKEERRQLKEQELEKQYSAAKEAKQRPWWKVW